MRSRFGAIRSRSSRRPRRAAGIEAADLAALGVTNQRETTVLWDRRTGKPLYNALVWQDTRVDALVAAYATRRRNRPLPRKTGLPLASYFSALKLQWLLDEVPGARALAERATRCSARSMPGWSGT
jgi:glycerol kinase